MIVVRATLVVVVNTDAAMCMALSRTSTFSLGTTLKPMTAEATTAIDRPPSNHSYTQLPQTNVNPAGDLLTDLALVN
jgi:hypothetical protein